MLVISRTPLRISFFGGGTDYPDYYRQHGGAVLGVTINHYIHISIKTLKSRFFDHRIRIAYSKIEQVRHVKEIEHPSVRACLDYLGIQDDLDIHIFSDLPARTGLGSSSAFTVGFLQALHALRGVNVSKQQLAEAACHVEQNLIGENVGSQDQMHAAYGGLNLVEFEAEKIGVRPLDLSAEKENELERHLLIFYTGLTRHASRIVEEQLEQTRRGVNDASLQEMRHMVYQAEEICNSCPKEQIVLEMGKLLHESWKLKKSLSRKITTPSIDQAYTAAMEEGAFGGKLCGAGNGGFLAFLVPPERQDAVRAALHPLQEVDFRFEREGSTIIYGHG